MIESMRIFLCLTFIILLAGCSEDTSTQATEEPVEIETEHVLEETSQDEDSYPIDYCIVSGEKLGSMGDTIETTVQGRTVKLCCQMCKSKLNRDPEKYLAALDAAIAGSTDSMPSEVSEHDHDHDHE